MDRIYGEKERITSSNMKDVATHILFILQDEKPHSVENICSKLEERFENVNPLVIEKALDAISKSDNRLSRPNTGVYKYTHESFEKLLNNSDLVLDSIYDIAQNQVFHFERTIVHETDPSLLPEVKQHFNTYQTIMNLIDKTRG